MQIKKRKCKLPMVIVKAIECVANIPYDYERK